MSDETNNPEDVFAMQIYKWMQAKDALDKAKKLELDLRNELVTEMCFRLDIGTLNRGTTHLEGQGFKLTATVNRTFKVDEAMPPEFNSCPAIVHKRSIDSKLYDKSNDETKVALSDWVTSTLGQPSLKVKVEEE